MLIYCFYYTFILRYCCFTWSKILPLQVPASAFQVSWWNVVCIPLKSLQPPVCCRGCRFKRIIDRPVSALISSLWPYPRSGQTWINPTRNWVSYPGSRDVHMGHCHRLAAAMARGIHHTGHWLVVTMTVQIHHEERLRRMRSAERSECFLSATMRKWSLFRYYPLCWCNYGIAWTYGYKTLHSHCRTLDVHMC